MQFSHFYHNTNGLEEALNVLNQVSQMANLKDFFTQQKSPYISLQILAIALTSMPGFPALSLDELNANPTLLVSDVVRKKMTYFMGQTRFSNDFNTYFRQVFPDATANPVDWAKTNRELSTNLDSPEIKKILTTLVKKYSEPTV